jgi:molybdate transport system substrate-binding protein
VVILTAEIVARLADEKLLAASSVSDIGLVETALAVRADDRKLSVTDAGSLRDALLASDAIFVPDVKASTAGIHVAKVLAQLGIAEKVAGRLKIFPNGATAMRHLAESDASRPIGCTQSTEIISTKGVLLSGSLPPGCELATMYTGAVTAGATDPRHAKALIDFLIDADQRDLHSQAGFISGRK